MATAIGKVAAVFTASTAGLTAGVNTAKASLSSMEQTVTKMHGKLSALTAIEGAKVFGSLVGAAKDMAASMISAGNATAQMIDAQSKAAAKVGIALDAFTAISQAADLAGISQDKVTVAVQKMGVALVKAEHGSKSAAKAFEAIGLSAAELVKMSPDKAFALIAEHIEKLPTPAERTAAAIAIFGKAGKDLTPMFEGGAAAIKQATEEAYAFGTALDTESGKNVEAMNDSFTRLGKVFEGFRVQLVAAFAPVVTDQIEKLIEDLKQAGGMREVALQFAEVVGGAVLDLVDGAMLFAKHIKEALGLVKDAFSGIQAVVNLAGILGRNFEAGVTAAGAGVQGLAVQGQLGDANATLDRALEARRKAEENASQFLNWWNGTAESTNPEQTSGSRARLKENIDRMRAAMNANQASPEKPAEQGRQGGTGAAGAAGPRLPQGQAQPQRTESAAGPPPASGPKNRPVTEDTGQKQLTLLGKIAQALNVQVPEVTFAIPGAGGR